MNIVLTESKAARYPGLMKIAATQGLRRIQEQNKSDFMAKMPAKSTPQQAANPMFPPAEGAGQPDPIQIATKMPAAIGETVANAGKAVGSAVGRAAVAAETFRSNKIHERNRLRWEIPPRPGRVQALGGRMSQYGENSNQDAPRDARVEELAAQARKGPLPPELKYELVHLMKEQREQHTYDKVIGDPNYKEGLSFM